MSDFQTPVSEGGHGYDTRAVPNPTDVRAAAMDLLARREHSRRELRQKLQKRFKDPELVEAQLDRLAEERLQSDSRYAASFLRQCLSRGHGPVRIRHEMRQKGIIESEIDIAMSEEAPDWFTLAEAAYRRKFGLAPPTDIKEKAKRSRFMQYRGFVLDHYQHLLQ